MNKEYMEAVDKIAKKRNIASFEAENKEMLFQVMQNTISLVNYFRYLKSILPPDMYKEAIARILVPLILAGVDTPDEAIICLDTMKKLIT